MPAGDYRCHQLRRLRRVTPRLACPPRPAHRTPGPGQAPEKTKVPVRHPHGGPTRDFRNCIGATLVNACWWRGLCRLSSRPDLRSGKGAGSRAVHMQPPGCCTVQCWPSVARVPRNVMRVSPPRPPTPTMPTFGVVARRSRCVERVGFSHRAGPASAIPRRGAAPGDQGRCAGRRRRGRCLHRWPRAS